MAMYEGKLLRNDLLRKYSIIPAITALTITSAPSIALEKIWGWDTV